MKRRYDATGWARYCRWRNDIELSLPRQRLHMRLRHDMRTLIAFRKLWRDFR